MAAGRFRVSSMGFEGRKMASKDKEIPVEGYNHKSSKRTNNPPVGLAHLDRDETPVVTYQYDPNLDPQMVWTGKSERESFQIPAPSIHVHEYLSAQGIFSSLRRNRYVDLLFDFDELEDGKSIEFYQHELNWSNRLILGDSLIVMNSLLHRERMAGKVQAIYMDPPYGIKYNSNFQAKMGHTEVKDKNDEDLTREPEMIQAYRDTWELGVHSYLTHLRDRLTTSRELLSDTGSIFIQISEENIHRVRLLLDEVFGAENFVSMISYATTGGFAQSTELSRAGDYVLWFAKNKASMKVRKIYTLKDFGGAGGSAYSKIELPDGRRLSIAEYSKETGEKFDYKSLPKGAKVYGLDNITSQGSGKESQPFEFMGKTFLPKAGNHWKASYPRGMNALVEARRIDATENSLGYVRYFEDFPYMQISNLWTDTLGQNQYGSDGKKYVVQTGLSVVQRCLLMVTDPGDLVLDPTCGSGTTAFVAEQWGRRWITIDTSRVAASIARERVLTAVFPSFELLDETRGVDGGLKYEKAKRVTLGSIANSEEPEEIALVDKPIVNKGKIRVSGPFTFESLSRYSLNPFEESNGSRSSSQDHSDHVEQLLDALKTMGIPSVGAKPSPISEITKIEGISSLQAEGVASLGGKNTKFAVSVGPKFGPITMSQVQEALTDAIGYGLVVFAGFAFSPDAAERLSSGKVGNVPVSLLLANPDLLIGDLLKNTKSSQTFKLYSSPDISLEPMDEQYVVTVKGVDTYDAASGEQISLGKAGIKAWMVDSNYDSQVFNAKQVFFPDSDGWKNLRKALRSSIDDEVLTQLSGWTSASFERPETGKIAIRVITQDGNSSETIMSVQ